MTFIAIYYHKPWLPIVQNSQSIEKFLQCCENLPTDWAHLMNEETGEILCTWRKEGVIHSNPINIYTTKS